MTAVATVGPATRHMFHVTNDLLSCDELVKSHDSDCIYPRRARSALGVDTVLTLNVCLYVCMYVCMYVRALERKRLIGMT